MNNCPIVELMITFKYGIPVFSWINPSKEEMAANVGSSIESSNLIGGLLSAILSFSENLSGDSDQTLKQIKMANCSYQYFLSDDLIFFLGYDTNVAPSYEKLIDNFLIRSVNMYNSLFSDFYGNDMELVAQDFGKFSDYLNKSMSDDIWKIERTQSEILKDVKELLLDILGPMSAEIYNTNLRRLKVKARGADIDLNQFASIIVNDISMLMDPSQADQIGQEINSLILR